MALTCGIDIGSTNVKVVFVDESGRSVHAATLPTPRVSDGIGPTTDATALVSMLEAIIIKGWRIAGAGVPLIAIAAAGVGEDGIGVAADLRPTGLALPWFDTRASEEAAELRQSAAATPRAGIAVGPDRTAAKWLWLRRHRPEELRSAWRWIALTDYPAVWWSGVAFMSSTLAPRTACYDVHARTWIAPLLEASGAPSLPPLLSAGTAIGTLRAGPLIASGAASPRTVLVAGGHDHPIAAAAVRRIAPQARVDSMGTANLIYGEAACHPIPYLDHLMTFSIPPSGLAGLACLGVMELTAALSCAPGADAILRRLLDGAHIPGMPGGAASDDGDPQVIQLRGALERATFRASHILAAMDRAGTPAGPIYAAGGWARSVAFLELRASVFGQPIYTLDEPELAAVEAAFLGWQAVYGTSPDFSATRRVSTVEPLPDWTRAYAGSGRSIDRKIDAAITGFGEETCSATSIPPWRPAEPA